MSKYPIVGAVFFDLGGTLLHPVSVAQVYSRVGQKYGSKVVEEGLRARFLEAFRRQEEIDRTLDWKTGSEREKERWQAIVGEVLHDLEEFEPCFNELYGFYACPAGWTLDPDAPALLQELSRRGLRLGVASNYDRRLFELVRGIPELAALSHLIVSSEVGYRKPAKQFFDAVVVAVQVQAENVLLVGDDFQSDYEGAIASGLQAVLLDPRRKYRGTSVRRIDRLADVAELLSD